MFADLSPSPTDSQAVKGSCHLCTMCLPWPTSSPYRRPPPRQDGRTALMLAAFYGYPDAVRLLLASRADLTAINQVPSAAAARPPRPGIAFGRGELARPAACTPRRASSKRPRPPSRPARGVGQFGETALDEARDGQRTAPVEGHPAVIQLLEAAAAAAAAASATADTSAASAASANDADADAGRGGAGA